MDDDDDDDDGDVIVDSGDGDHDDNQAFVLSDHTGIILMRMAIAAMLKMMLMSKFLEVA